MKNKKANTTIKCEETAQGKRCCVFEKPYRAGAKPIRCFPTRSK